MNKIIFFILLLYSSNLYSQRFIDKKAEISFFSEALIEDISAKNNKVSVVYDVETKQLVFQLNISDFVFQKPLMQEHFNENYLESDIYPSAIFIGRLVNIRNSKATVQGDLTIHGKT
ncbi:MAG: YceI family protein, partial [Flavobacteriales bacterium]|nr:YceI family protein [Flavobacteriales bacterium]